MLVQAVADEPLINPSDIEHIRAQVRVLDDKTPGRLRLSLAQASVVEQLLTELRCDKDVFRASWQVTTGSLLLQFNPRVLHQQLLARVIDLLADIVFCNQLCFANDYDQRWQSINWHHLSVEQVLEQISTLPAQPKDQERRLELLSVLAFDPNVNARWAWAVCHQFVRNYHQGVSGRALWATLKHTQGQELNLLRHLFAQRLQALEHISRVKRAGQWCNLAQQDLQLGDLIEISDADQLAVDVRLIDSDELMVEEGLATGFYQENLKQHQFTLNLAMPLDDRSNMVWAGSRILTGKAQAVVVATGLETQMFKYLAQLLVEGQAFDELACFTE